MQFRLKIAAVAATAACRHGGPESCGTASRLPQSRRLRLHPSMEALSSHFRLKIAAVAATAAGVSLPDDRYRHRLKIAAVAATAARPARRCSVSMMLPPQDCRSRGDCGRSRHAHTRDSFWPPQDCRSRGDCGQQAAERPVPDHGPPQDCRSRGDCGCT